MKKTQNRIVKPYIFINKKKLIAGQKNASKIIGSIMQLQRENIKIDGVVLDYVTLHELLGKNKYYNDKNYYIRRTIIERSKHKEKLLILNQL